ncbi:hypothetical protein [Cellulophaga baltica]|nr:hypothetical protein [Cellulophaga baltica]
MMKFALFLCSVVFMSCSTKIKNKENSVPITPASDSVITSKLSFEETQNALRNQLLKSKPNELLKSSILQELYLRGLVEQVEDRIVFELPFNLHGFDCGAPDCYVTDIRFEIAAKEPIEFPETIPFKIVEHGCGIEKEIAEEGVFERIEQSPTAVHYYAKKQRGSLVLISDPNKLYYFPDTELHTIKVNAIDELFATYDEEDEQAIEPYQSFLMTTNEYEFFIKN